uniref:uncharacterized protein LOC105352700 n=1 Tax=Fragaria vesca subsp. vesca TaxID=101020 RepID=UPI0005CAA641|nr:PREDICTED: uncharacterized protein LOC105352700 [Fragaria vesca subsp. vesca]
MGQLVHCHRGAWKSIISESKRQRGGGLSAVQRNRRSWSILRNSSPSGTVVDNGGLPISNGRCYRTEIQVSLVDQIVSSSPDCPANATNQGLDKKISAMSSVFFGASGSTFTEGRGLAPPEGLGFSFCVR